MTPQEEAEQALQWRAEQREKALREEMDRNLQDQVREAARREYENQPPTYERGPSLRRPLDFFVEKNQSRIEAMYEQQSAKIHEDFEQEKLNLNELAQKQDRQMTGAQLARAALVDVPEEAERNHPRPLLASEFSEQTKSAVDPTRAKIEHQAALDDEYERKLAELKSREQEQQRLKEKFNELGGRGR